MAQGNKQDSYKSLLGYQFNDDNKKVSRKDPPRKESPKYNEDSKYVKKDEIEIINFDVPSRQYGDLYCVVCDSHMNSEQMWENHIQGKRHLKNSRKPEAAEQKYEFIYDDPIIQEEISKETRPIAGLEHICEIQRIEQTPMYQCFLCSANLHNSNQLIDHILGLKHRSAFLKEHVKEKYSLIEAAPQTKSTLEPIVEDLILKYEEEHGRGKISVKREKPKSGILYSKTYKEKGTLFSKTYKEKETPQLKTSKEKGSKSKTKYDEDDDYERSSKYKRKHDDDDYDRPSKYIRDDKDDDDYEYSSKYSSRIKERHSDYEWEKVSPVREKSHERRYSDKSYSDKYSDEEKWKKVDTESSFYRRTSHQDIPDSKRDKLVTSNSRPYTVQEERKDSNDLRNVLEHRKNLGTMSVPEKPSMAISAPVPTSSEIDTVSDELLYLVHDMSPKLFLSLALFKLESITIQEQQELQLLDRVGNKASNLYKELKMKLQTPDLKTKYKESLAQSGISSWGEVPDTSVQSNLQFTQKMDSLIGHYKAQKTTLHDVSYPSPSYSNNLKAPERPYSSNGSTPPLPPRYSGSSTYQNISERDKYSTDWNHRSSNSSFPFQSFSSSSAYIPGLTLTEQTTPPSAPIEQFAQTAKNIFGNINVPSTPINQYRNEDVNRFSYR